MTSLKWYGRETVVNCIRRAFHEPQPPTVGESVAKAHAELSEFFEAWQARNETGPKWYGENCKPEGLGPELADVVLQVAYIAARLNIDLDAELAEKHAYNNVRPPTTRRL